MTFSPPPYSDADNDTVRRMWAEGASLSEIGAVLGRTRSSVAGRVRRLGLPKKGASHNRHAASVKAAQARWGEPRIKKPFSFKQAKPKERKPPMLLRVVSVPDSKPVPLQERTGCCYPTTTESPHLFCNERTEGGSYCNFHRAVMYPRWRAA